MGRPAVRLDVPLTALLVHAAIRRRCPPSGLIFHSDRGSEFLGTPFRACLAAAGVQQSMTRGGAPDENAHMESFFHSLKAELTHGQSFAAVAARESRGFVRFCA
jgi:transposase InsO family protein